jgi:DNA-binding NtrC family response regulator
MGAGEPALDPATISVLSRHSWPGNVRELRNCMEYAVIVANGVAIKPEHLPANVAEGAAPVARGARVGDVDVRDQIAAIERKAVEDALASEKGNQTRAATRLGLTRRALIYRMEKYRIAR